MRLTSTGLGIGTSSPAQKLHVQSATPVIQIQDTTSAAGGVGGTINFVGFTSGTSGANVEAQIKGVKSSANAAGELQFFTSNSAGTSTQRAIIDGSGNLGLGVTPSAWASAWKALQITDVASLTANSSTGATILGNNYFVNSSGSDSYRISGYASAIYRQLAGTHAWFTAPSGTAGNAISFSQVMTLDASGNLGVGTTSPVYRLSVKQSGNTSLASFGFTVANSANDTQMGMGYDATSDTLRLSATYTSTGAYKPLSFWTSDTERARIDSSGNLLVGLTSATGVAKLQVSGAIRTTGFTVATLPAGTVGMRTYVTDALAPSFGVTVSGGGAVTIPVFYNGTNWIVA
jgi:hypothetical protein